MYGEKATYDWGSTGCQTGMVLFLWQGLKTPTMPNHLSFLGIVHTIISILALAAAFYALIAAGTVDPQSRAGRIYVWLTVLTCITAFPIMRTGHFGPAHVLGVLVLIVLAVAIFARQLRIFGGLWLYFQTVLMSFTVFLSLVPAINESFTRLPVSHPLASGPGDPLIKQWLGILLVVFLLFAVWQLFRLRTRARKDLLLGNP